LIPIEVKAEHQDISRERVQANYLSQEDEYATARDNMACLMVLDVRAQNSDRHVRRQTSKQASASVPPQASAQAGPVKSYSLRNSFWIDGLPPDPQIRDPEKNAVLVGLVMGNRARPSSGTKYSRR
jgi:hypothetical protein